MTLRERQDQFLDVICQLHDWTEKFNFLIGYASLLDPACPESLKAFRIESCQSRTYFRAEIRAGRLYVDGWSSSAVTGGVIVACMKIFDGLPASELALTEIDFHTRSGLVENMTPLRSDALREIVRRIQTLLHVMQKPAQSDGICNAKKPAVHL
jgi:cysteine desulfuration protein SufE